MNREQMIEEIQEKIADKTLSFGCKIGKNKYEDGNIIGIQSIGRLVKVTDPYEGGFSKKYYVKRDRYNGVVCWGDSHCTIIGHPVMIGDVLDYINIIDYQHGYIRGTDTNEKALDEILLLRRYLKKPIEGQSEQCIKYIHGLLSE